MPGRGGCGGSGVPLAAGPALAVVPDAGLRAGRRVARRGRTLPPLPPGQRLRRTEGQAPSHLPFILDSVPDPCLDEIKR